eukprot:gene7434-8698_t
MALENPIVAKGLRKFSTRAFEKRTKVFLTKKNKVVTPKKAVVAPVVTKPARYAPVNPAEVRRGTKVHNTASISLRASITPGTVLIIVAGRFAGKRVVFLKQLASGLLLITGPFRLNGVPLRRIDQRYVIATSTKVDVAAVKVADTINDAYFKAEKKAVAKKAEGEFFKDGKKEKKEKKMLPEVRIADQKAVDAAILATLKTQPEMTLYLKSKFALKKGDFPHALKF